MSIQIFEVFCGSCNESYHLTTDKYDPEKKLNGSMFVLKPEFGPSGSNWQSFPDTVDTVDAELCCPSCTACYVSGNGMTLRPFIVAEISSIDIEGGEVDYYVGVMNDLLEYGTLFPHDSPVPAPVGADSPASVAPPSPVPDQPCPTPALADSDPTGAPAPPAVDANSDIIDDDCLGVDCNSSLSDVHASKRKIRFSRK